MQVNEDLVDALLSMRFNKWSASAKKALLSLQSLISCFCYLFVISA